MHAVADLFLILAQRNNLQYGRFQKKPQQETQSLKTRHVIISFRNKPKSEETQGTLISMGSWNFFRKLYFFHVS